MPQAIGSYSVEERILDGGTAWVAIRARGAEWLFKPEAVPGPPIWRDIHGPGRAGGAGARPDGGQRRAHFGEQVPCTAKRVKLAECLAFLRACRTWAALRSKLTTLKLPSVGESGIPLLIEPKSVHMHPTDTEDAERGLTDSATSLT